MSVLDWLDQAACAAPGQDCTDWDSDTPGSGLSEPNRRALGVCDSCPVRAECRDDALAWASRPGRKLICVIVGGWRWNAVGQPTPHRDDRPILRDLVERARQLPARHGGPATQPERATNFVAAGRAMAGGGDANLIAGRHRLAVKTVTTAGWFVRHAPPGLVADVQSGRVGIYDAVEQVRAVRRGVA